MFLFSFLIWITHQSLRHEGLLSWTTHWHRDEYESSNYHCSTGQNEDETHSWGESIYTWESECITQKSKQILVGKCHCITKSQLNIWCDIYFAVHKHAGTLELLQGTHLSKPIFWIIRNKFARWCITMQSHRSKLKILRWFDWQVGLSVWQHTFGVISFAQIKDYCTINNFFYHYHHTPHIKFSCNVLLHCLVLV